MNLNLLAPALQGIINAVDELPGRKGQHVPKALLEAVENARLAIAQRSLPPLSDDPNVNYMRNRILELREMFSPTKQRITLRGGPLDGCWYLYVHRFGDGSVCVPTIQPDGSERLYRYSIPDSHGICYYRE